MKGPILGILAIFLLQLGFISYTRVTSIFESAAEIEPISAAETPFPEYSDLDVVDADRNQVNIRYSAQTVGIRERHSATSRSSPRTPPAIRTFETDLAPISIRVPRPSPYVFVSYEKPPAPDRRTEYPSAVARTGSRGEVETIRVNTVERKKRRSFTSKTLAVIRKPFDWMKAIGSKLK